MGIYLKTPNIKPVKLEKTTPMQMRRRGCEMRLVIGGSTAANTHYDSTLVKSIARAHVWFQELTSGKTKSLLELAERHNVSDSYVKKIIPLAFIAPDIVTKLISGKSAHLITQQLLIRQMKLPICWEQQNIN